VVSASSRGRVMPAAIILIIVNVLSILAGLSTAGYGLNEMLMGPDALRQKILNELAPVPAMQEAAAKQDKQLQYTVALAEHLGGGLLWLLLSIIALVGAIRMMSLRSYGLAVASSVLTLIPCVTPCCFLGQIAGVWGLIVLMNSEVRSAFR
jgi:hypothetical protein